MNKFKRQARGEVDLYEHLQLRVEALQLMICGLMRQERRAEWGGSIGRERFLMRIASLEQYSREIEERLKNPSTVSHLPRAQFLLVIQREAALLEWLRRKSQLEADGAPFSKYLPVNASIKRLKNDLCALYEGRHASE